MLENLTWAAAMKYGGAIAAGVAALAGVLFLRTIRKAFPKLVALPAATIFLFLFGAVLVFADMLSSAGGAIFGFYHVPTPLLIVLAVVAASSALVATFTDRLFVRAICLATSVTTSALAMLTSVTLNEAIMGDGAVTAPASVEASMNWRKNAVEEARLALADARGAVKGAQLDAQSARKRIDALNAEKSADTVGTALFKEIEALETVLTEGKYGFLNAKQIADLQVRAGMEGSAIDGRWGDNTRIALGKHIEDKRAQYARRNDALNADLRKAEAAKKAADGAQVDALQRVEDLQARYDAAVIAAEGTQENAELYAGAAHAALARDFVMRWASGSTTKGDAAMASWWNVCLYFAVLLTAMGQTTLRQAFRIMRRIEPVANDNDGEKAPRRFRGVYGGLRIARGYLSAGDAGAEAARKRIDAEQSDEKTPEPEPVAAYSPWPRPSFFEKKAAPFEKKEPPKPAPAPQPAAAGKPQSRLMGDLADLAERRNRQAEQPRYRSFAEADKAMGEMAEAEASGAKAASGTPPKRRRRAGRR